jgi:teichuronic acid biosynthesis glycosyltransferase TuaH
MDDPAPLVVIVAGGPFDGVRSSARAVADALSPYVQVLYVDPARSSLRGRTGQRRSPIAKPQLETNGSVHHLTPMMMPAHTRRGVRRVVRRQVLLAINEAISSIGTAPTAVLQESLQLPLLGELDEPWSVVWATDAFVEGAELMGMDRAAVDRFEEEAALVADLAIVVSPIIAKGWEQRGVPSVVIPNGVDLFPEGDMPVRDQGRAPTAVVSGTLSHRIDMELLAGVADSGVDIILVGPASFRGKTAEFDQLTSRTNVEWTGLLPHDQLPGIYRRADVGLVPYTLSPFNLASFPLKALEYLAAGLPVVSTDLPSIRHLASPDIAIATDAASFSHATHQASTDRDDRDLIRRRKEFAGQHSWDEVARQILRSIGLGHRTG